MDLILSKLEQFMMGESEKSKALSYLAEKVFPKKASSVTQGALDVEILGEGFFALELKSGLRVYTRQGSFQIGLNSYIEDQKGRRLASQTRIPKEAVSIEISSCGSIRVIDGSESKPEVIGKIALVLFKNPAGLKPLGDRLFLPTSRSGLPQEGAPGVGGLGYLQQGQFETSHIHIHELDFI